MGMCGALAAPAWLLITTLLVRTAELDSAIAIDTAGYNVARAIGPAIAGYAIARLSIAVPFWCCCVGNLALLAALIWWRAPRRPKETLPAERLVSAMTTGVRYVRYSREMDATLIRTIAFFPFASAYLALLPLVARSEAGNGAEVYGQLMAAVGVGSIVATLALGWLKRRLSGNGQAALGALGTAVSLCLLAAAREPVLAFVASFISGAASIVALTTFFVSAQVALPEWVRGRGLAIFLTVYFGALTLGSAVWGEVATVKGVPFALYCAGVGTLIGLALTWAWKLQTSEAQDLTPSMRWRSPSFAHRVADDEGPILAIVDYLIDPSESGAFLAMMQDIGLERRRDGAYAWHIFEDPNQQGKMVETFLIHSLLELRYRAGARHQGGRDDREPGGAVFEGAGREPLPCRAPAPATVALVEPAGIGPFDLRGRQCRRRYLARRVQAELPLRAAERRNDPGDAKHLSSSVGSDRCAASCGRKDRTSLRRHSTSPSLPADRSPR